MVRNMLLAIVFAGLALPAAAQPQADNPKAPPGSIKIKVEVEIEGILTQHVLAITGERYSILVGKAETAFPMLAGQKAQERFDLDFSAARELLPLARELAGKRVIIQGKCVMLGVSTFPAPKSVPVAPGAPPANGGYYSVLNLDNWVIVEKLTVARKDGPGGEGKTPAKEPMPAPVELKKAGDLPPAAQKKLAAGKVPTEKEATNLALNYKFKHGGGILAQESWQVAGVYVDNTGDPVWVVRFVIITGAFPAQPGPYEAHVNATTGEAWRPISPAK